MAIPDCSTPLNATGGHATAPLDPLSAGEGVLPQQSPSAQAQQTPAATSRRAFPLILTALVLIFAFLASSFPIRNSDYWFHLATGRLLAEGKYHFGVDPFAFTTEGVYWTNHAWLYDLILYKLYGLMGGTGLIVLKGVLITALAGILLVLRRRGAAGWLPVVGTLLALLAISPRLLLQPACLSYFFLAVTLWCLWRGQGDAEEGREIWPLRRQVRHYALLPLLFVLWVNVDEWFWLGPLLTALFWAGERLQGRRRTPGWVVPLGLAVCLLNPHGYHAFTLPASLSLAGWDSGLRQDPRFRRLFVSPWGNGLPIWSASGLNLAALAYFALVGGGLFSFVLAGRKGAGWRLLAWAVLALLGAWEVRNVPFFAVVAGPIMVLNLQDFLGAHGPRKAAWPSFLTGLASFVLLAISLALIALAWLGSLQGWRLEGRQVAWGEQPDPSLKHMAETLQRWRQDGRLGENEHGFAFHPEVAQYCAWFCPDEKGYFDHRLALFPKVASEYEAVCRELNPSLRPAKEQASESAHSAVGSWQQVFRERSITHLILFDPDPQLLLATMSRLNRNSRDWVLLHVDGQAVLFGWRQSKRPTTSLALADRIFDADELAFGRQGKEEVWALPPAPGEGPGRGPHRPRWWEHDGKPNSLPAWEHAAANVYLRLFEDAAAAQRQEALKRGWNAYAAGLTALPAQTNSPLSIALGMVFRFPPGLGERPPALPLLAIRATRRALAENPDDAGAYLRLAHAYRMLRDETCEHSREGRLPPLAMLRHVQIVTALTRALQLNPNLEAAHQNLAELYSERRYLDIALEHQRAALALARRGKPLPGEDADKFNRRLSQAEDQVRALEDVVLEQQNQFAVQAELLRDNPLGRAQLALSLGLSLKALDDVLLKSDVLLFGTAGARLELELMLTMGRVEEAGAQLSLPELQEAGQTLGFYDIPGVDVFGQISLRSFPAYEWLVCCQAVAVGDYDRAAAVLQKMSGQKQTDRTRNLRNLRRMLPALLTTELGAKAQPEGIVFQFMAQNDREQAMELLAQTYRLQGEQADLYVMAGMLDLESGLPQAARPNLEKGLALYPTDAETALFSAGRALARDYLQRLRGD
jgi:hypothetical protein